MLKRDWIVCSKYNNHPSQDSQDNFFGGGERGEGGLEYNHLMRMRVFTLMMNKILRTDSKYNEKSGYGLDLDMLAILY